MRTDLLAIMSVECRHNTAKYGRGNSQHIYGNAKRVPVIIFAIFCDAMGDATRFATEARDANLFEECESVALTHSSNNTHSPFVVHTRTHSCSRAY